MKSEFVCHQLPVQDVLSRFGSDPRSGLSESEVLSKRNQFGRNEIRRTKGKSTFKILLRQFSDFLILVLMGAAIVSGLVGEPEDTYAIIAIVIINAILGFFQEYRAERAIEALRNLAAPQATVKRVGRIVTVPASELVPGDIVLLEAGVAIPADLRLVEAHQFRVDESALTGESVPVEKKIAPILESGLTVGDQKNMAFKGTLVTNGRATGVVTATGARTELGRIADLLQKESEVQTPLQRRLAGFAKKLAMLVLVVCVLIFVVGVLRGEPTLLMFMTALSLAVAAIPEALPAVVTVSLSLGARKMARRNALVRKLPAVETLGSVTYVCSDKTGTLTWNRMRVERFYLSGREFDGPPSQFEDDLNWKDLFRILALSHDAYLSDRGEATGDPTEVAMAEIALQHGFSKNDLEKTFPRIAEIPFSSERGLMSTFHRADEKTLMYSKGAPEKLLPLCSKSVNGAFDLQKELDVSRNLARQGYRVLALAKKESLSSAEVQDMLVEESDLTYVGLVGLVDPPRKEAHAAVRDCHSAGINAVMITGDHPETAVAIAKKLEILTNESDQRVVTGRDLTEMSDDEFSKIVTHVRVYARVAPEQKIRIVKALQSHNQVVSMTGDGVNDAPALRRADIGVAMGKQGTDVAREAAHMVLLDDNFATIVAAINEGRRLYDNIRKFVRFAITGNSAEILTLFAAPFLGLPMPLLPIQILWINLITDGLPGLALAVEPAEKDIMARKPRPPGESIFAHGLGLHTIWVGILTAAVTLAVQAYGYANELNWQSMAFTVLGLSQMGHVMAIRSDRYSLFTIGVFSNIPLLLTVVFTILLQVLVLYLPVANEILRTRPLTLNELSICFASSIIVFVAVEIEKFSKRRRHEQS